MPLWRLLERPAGDADQIDAVPIAATVGQIVAEVRAVDRDALSVWQYAHVVPVDLRVAEGGPAVRLVRAGREKVRAIIRRRGGGGG